MKVTDLRIWTIDFKWSAITVLVWLLVIVLGIASTLVLGAFFGNIAAILTGGN